MHNIIAYSLPCFRHLYLRVMENEIDSPHFGNNGTKAEEVSQRLGPGSELYDVIIYLLVKVLQL